MYICLSLKDPYCRSNRWVAVLSDGTTVFEDNKPGERSSWRRLKDYVNVHNLKIETLKLESYGRTVNLIPYKDSNNNPQINGYWQSKKINSLLFNNGIIEYNLSGIGIVKGKSVWITWIDECGGVIQETREYKRNDEAVILNDEV